MAGCLIMVSACTGAGKRHSVAEGTSVSSPSDSVSEAVAVGNMQSFATDSVVSSDSLTLAGSRATAKIVGLYPSAGNSALVDSVRSWIGRRLSYANMFNGKPMFTPTPGELQDGKILVKMVTDSLMEASRIDFGEFVKDSISVNYEFDIRFKPTFESDSLITYTYSGYGYYGGAHGGSTALSQTFNRNSGVALTYANSFIPSGRSELIGLIKEELWNQYFKEDFESSGERGGGTLRDALLINPDTLPLPVCPPDFRSDGVVFLYQQYEIACYAAGMPSCLISYEALEPLMTPEVKKLVP